MLIIKNSNRNKPMYEKKQKKKQKIKNFFKKSTINIFKVLMNLLVN